MSFILKNNRMHKSLIEKLIRTSKKYSITTSIAYYSNSKVRVRFAPSPTGFLHLGGLRTALYNYLFAKSHNGQFILRIEDTDTARTIPESIEGIQNDLQWLSLTPDESPNNGGSFGPYVQSERAHLYQKYAEELLQKSCAYKCFCSLDRLKDLRQASLSYDNKCRSLTPNQVEKLMKENAHYCIRFKLEKKEDHLNDLIFGDRKINVPQGEGDPVIVKTGGLPTYHFANVIDDHLMQISHVFRGDEWLSSVSKHLQLYRCFNWTPPSFGHLPQILNPDGTKLSKRQQGLHVQSLREEGFSPEAILNFVKLSGGGFTDIDHEKMSSLTQLVHKFRLECVNTHPAPFDLDRLRNYNRMDFASKMADERQREILIRRLEEKVLKQFGEDLDSTLSQSYLEKVAFWGQARIFKLDDFLAPNFLFLWVHPEPFCREDVAEFKLDAKNFFKDLMESLSEVSLSDFTSPVTAKLIKSTQAKYDAKTAPVMKILRKALTGEKVGPPVSETMELLGKKTCLSRLKRNYEIL